MLPDHLPTPLVMAHRGDSAHAPENTLAAFRLALEAGANLLETDLWFSADDQIICHHDATLQRMTGFPARVVDLPLADIQALPIRSRFDANYPNERIPSLQQLLDLTPPGVMLGLELKDPRFADPARAVRLVRQVADRLAANTVLVLSFHKELLAGVRAVAPSFPTGHITLRNPWPDRRARFAGPYWPLLLANPLYVRQAHRQGTLVCPLDPAPERRLGLYLRLGVDAIITNDPGGMLRRLGR